MTFFQPFLLLAFLPLAVPTCPDPCRCAGNIVDCMSAHLTDGALPAGFAPSTRTIYLNNNELTSIPSGLFDNLGGLQAVYLWGNPWACDCHILYLRAWLQWQQNRTAYRNVACSSPSHLQGRIIAYLSEDEVLATCQYWYCSVALFSQIGLFVFILLQALLLVLLLIYVRRFQKIAKEARRTAAEFYEQGDPWAAAGRKGAD